MPMIAFNPKDINQKNEKNSSSSAETSSEDSSQKEKRMKMEINKKLWNRL